MVPWALSPHNVWTGREIAFSAASNTSHEDSGMLQNIGSIEQAAATFEPARGERLHRIVTDIEARARRVFPALPDDQLASFANGLAGHRLQEEERRSAAR